MSETGRPTKYEEDMPLRVREWLLIVRDNIEDKKVNLPTMASLARHLGVNKDTLYEWAKKYDEFSDSLADVKQEQEKRLIDQGLAGNYNSTIAKLILSSNHGYREKQDVDVTSQGEKVVSFNYTIPKE